MHSGDDFVGFAAEFTRKCREGRGLRRARARTEGGVNTPVGWISAKVIRALLDEMGADKIGYGQAWTITDFRDWFEGSNNMEGEDAPAYLHEYVEDIARRVVADLLARGKLVRCRRCGTRAFRRK